MSIETWDEVTDAATNTPRPRPEIGSEAWERLQEQLGRGHEETDDWGPVSRVPSQVGVQLV